MVQVEWMDSVPLLPSILLLGTQLYATSQHDNSIAGLILIQQRELCHLLEFSVKVTMGR